MKAFIRKFSLFGIVLFGVTVGIFPVYADMVSSDISTSTPVQHLVWNKAPIDVILPVGKERMVSFPDAVQFGYDRAVLSDNKLRVQNNDGTLYFLSRDVFAPQRVEVKLASSNKIILLNLSSQPQADSTPLDVVMPTQPATSSNADDNDGDVGVDYQTLMRYAVQQLYAPSRLLTQPANIYRAVMHTPRTVPLFLDGSVVAMPQISWRGGDYTVTAITLRNLTPHDVDLTVKSLCGSWPVVTFFPLTTLKRKGTLIRGVPYDTTTAFLISTQSFGESIGVCNGMGV